ncbi:MAG: DUF3109 family protein [Desulfobacterales bacterium]|nr:DUF3109 family protein [Desulfobacterales bacterium]
MKTNIVIDGIEIDMEAIYSIHHECLPEKCKNSKSCCASYLVSIDENELENITGWMPEAATFCPGLKSGSGYKNVFEEEDDDNLFSLDAADDDACVFAYLNEENQTLCSLHSAALEMGEPPAKVKPRSCTLWPLAVSDGHPTLLTIDASAFSFICNSRRTGDPDQLSPQIAEIIEDLFGKKFLDELIRAPK